MTANTTEQERAKFEAWARDRYPSIDLTRDGDDYDKALAKDYWSLWQAARRAPVVPQGWKLVPVEPTQEVLDAIDLMADNHRAFDDSDSFWRHLVAAAPQPPEATVNDSLTVEAAAPDVADIIAGELQTSRGNAYDLMEQALSERDADRALIEAAPAQLPEIDIDTANHAGIRVRGYTQETVRQLLADQQFKLDELAMLTRMVVHAFRQVAPDNKTAAKAVDYLKRKGLAGNPLRAAQEQST